MLVSHTIWGKSVTLLDNSIVIVVSPGRFFFSIHSVLLTIQLTLSFHVAHCFYKRKGTPPGSAKAVADSDT